MIEDKGTRLRWPQNSAVQVPAGSAGNVSGVGAQGEHYFAWAQVVQDGTRCIAATPLTRRYLSEMVPGLGDVFFRQVSTTPKKPPAKGLQIKTDTSKQAGVTAGDQQFDLRPGLDAPGAALPPPANRLDLDVLWFSLLPASDWVDPSRSVFGMLGVHTRYS